MSVCAYCGRVLHRCTCAEPTSRLHRFYQRNPTFKVYIPRTRPEPYKRGVPPQIKRRERATLNQNRAAWYALLVKRDGERCANCGSPDDLALDHIQPVARGGVSAPENLQLLCRTCNALKGKLVIDCRGEFRT